MGTRLITITFSGKATPNPAEKDNRRVEGGRRADGGS